MVTSAAPTLDIRNTLPASLAKLNISQGFFAEFCGLNKVEFSRLMNGAKPMSNDQTKEFYAALSDMQWMIEQLYPLRPAMKTEDAERVKNFIKALREYRETALSAHQIRVAWESAA